MRVFVEDLALHEYLVCAIGVYSSVHVSPKMKLSREIPKNDKKNAHAFLKKRKNTKNHDLRHPGPPRRSRSGPQHALVCTFAFRCIFSFQKYFSAPENHFPDFFGSKNIFPKKFRLEHFGGEIENVGEKIYFFIFEILKILIFFFKNFVFFVEILISLPIGELSLLRMFSENFR